MAPFPWLTVGYAAYQGISSLVTSLGRNAEVDARNREKTKQFERDEDWSINQYNYGEIQADVNYSWDLAKFEALKYQNAEDKLYYEFAQDQGLDAAINNLELNTEALKDQYITGENLRAQQAMLDLGLTTSRNTTELGQLELQGKDLASQAQLNKLQAQTQIKDFLIGVKENANAQNQIMQRQAQETQTLLSSIASDVMLEKFEQDITQIANMVEEGQASARATVRTGGTSTSRQLAMNYAKNLGRAYGEMKINQERRNQQVVRQNLQNKGSAMQMYGVALQTQKLANRGESVSKTADIRQQQLGNQFNSVRLDADKVANEQQYTENVFTDLTLPGFDLAQRQGGRELQALELNTLSTMTEIGMPYRDPIMFAPQRALPGLRPYNTGPTMESKQSLASTIGGVITSAAQGAMSTTYKKTGGGIGFL